MEQQAGEYRALVADGVLKVLQMSERYLTVVNVSPQGTEVNAVPYSSISPAANASPVLMATWAGDGCAHVDLDCGAQRWNGSKSLRWLRRGLNRAGFTSEQIDGLLCQMKTAGKQEFCPRCC